MASPARDVKAAGSGRKTGGSKKPGLAAAARNAALAAEAARSRVGTASTLHPTANLGPTLPAVNAGDNDGDEMPSTAPRVAVKGHTRAMPGAR